MIVSPMAEMSEGEAGVPQMACDVEGPFRCKRCGAYANPGFSFIESGSKVVCNLCNEVHTNDAGQISELQHGAYEFDVGGRYIYGKMRSHNYVFLIETTVEAIQVGLLESVVGAI